MGPQSNFVLQWYISRQTSPSIVPGDVNLAELFDTGAQYVSGQMFVFCEFEWMMWMGLFGISWDFMGFQCNNFIQLSGEEETEEDKKNKPEPKQQDEDWERLPADFDTGTLHIVKSTATSAGFQHIYIYL